MSFLLKSCNDNNIMNTSSTNNLDIEKQKLKDIMNNKYTNNSIFTKRDIGFNKSLEKNKTTFKYRKYHSYFEIAKNNKNKNDRNNIKKNNSFNSLYLTEYIFINKSKNKFNNNNINNNSSLHSFKKSRSHFFKSDKSIYTNITNNTSRKNNTNINNISNNYLSFIKGQIFPNKSFFLTNSNKNKNNKKINLKLYNPRYLLNVFETEKENEKKNKLKIELEYKHLYKKQSYLNYERKKGLDRHKYLERFNGYFIEKKNLENLNEKKNRVKEENDYKLKIANDSVNKAQKAYEDFNDIYFVKYNKFIIKQKSKIKNEKIKCDNYIDIIIELKKEINSLIIKINKTKINIDFLNKFALLNAKIHLKQISLPIYYEYIFENKKSELNKYNLNEQDVQNILQYKKNIDLNKMLSLLTNYESADLNLLNEYNYLLNDINILKKRKKDFYIDLKHKNNDIPESIISSENELDKLKENYHELINTKHILLSNYAIKNMNNKKNKKSIKSVRKSSIIINYNELYFKTIKIFNNLSDYINHNLDYIKKPKLVEDVQDLIKYNFEKIEVLANILLERINKFKQDNPQKEKIFKEMMDKKRKIRNDLEQRKKNEILIKLKKEKIEMKNKKVLSIKRANIYNYNLMAKYKKRNKSKKIIKADTIFDYIIP